MNEEQTTTDTAPFWFSQSQHVLLSGQEDGPLTIVCGRDHQGPWQYDRPADAVRLVPVTELHTVVCQKVAELNECYEEISRLNRKLAEVQQSYDRTFNRLYDIETGAPDA